MSEKKIKVEFAPGCFDHFEGSQEELDELITEINRLIETGELFEKGQAIDLEEMLQDPEEREWAEKVLQSLENGKDRPLQ